VTLSVPPGRDAIGGISHSGVHEEDCVNALNLFEVVCVLR